VVELPSCTALYEVNLSQVSTVFDCQQIRSYRLTAMILFARKQGRKKYTKIVPRFFTNSYLMLEVLHS
jgi:hypothetical protein